MKFTELVREQVLSEIPFDPEISFVTPDPDKCTDGSLFVCIKGFTRDGHESVDIALGHGAAAIITDGVHPQVNGYLQGIGIPYAVYGDTRSALSILTSRLYGDPQRSLHVTAVTGTNGKTTTVAILNAIYTAAGCNSKAIGTLDGGLTTPDPCELYPLLASFRDSGVTHVFMEASSHALALNKLDPMIYDNAIFTNLTSEHRDFHITMEDYAKAKAKLFPASSKAFINVDSDYASAMISASDHPISCSAINASADVSARNVKLMGASGIIYDLFAHNGAFRIESPMPGSHTVMNTLQAAACAYFDGISHRTIRYAVKNLRSVKGRLERLPLPTSDFSVYIDFAHTPDALKTLLVTVRSFMKKGQRLVLLFGCGGDRDRTKRPSMGSIASALSDFVIVTSDNSRSEPTSSIIADIMSGFDHECPHTVIDDRRRAIEFAVHNASDGDVIVLAGKGHEEYQTINGTTLPFSERQIVLDAVKTCMKGRGQF